MKLLLIVLFFVSRSQSINYDALVPCTDDYGEDGVECDGVCRPAAGHVYDAGWCNDMLVEYCEDSGVMTNDTDLCSDDDFWKQISCDLTWGSRSTYGERCTGCITETSNYCFYPYDPHLDDDLFRTKCDCNGTQSSNYDALAPCKNNQGMMCDGWCLPAAYWCNDKLRYNCDDSGILTNDEDLCSDDERWKEIDCNMTSRDGKVLYPGERCSNCTTGTRNYCFYPQGFREDFIIEDLLYTTCDCVTKYLRID